MLRTIAPTNDTCPSNLKYAPCGTNQWTCSPSGYDTLDQACQNPSTTSCGVDTPGTCVASQIPSVDGEETVIVTEKSEEQLAQEAEKKRIAELKKREAEKKLKDAANKTGLYLILYGLLSIFIMVLWIYLMIHAISYSRNGVTKTLNFLLAFFVWPLYLLEVLLFKLF